MADQILGLFQIVKWLELVKTYQKIINKLSDSQEHLRGRFFERVKAWQDDVLRPELKDLIIVDQCFSSNIFLIPQLPEFLEGSANFLRLEMRDGQLSTIKT